MPLTKSENLRANPMLIIGDRWIGADQRGSLEVINPATEEVLCRVPIATPDDVTEAVKAAKIAFDGWRKTLPIERARVLRAAAANMRSRVDELARLMTLEQGKPLAESRAETLSAADLFEWFSEETRRSNGRIVASQVPGVTLNVISEPIGPVAGFTAWNFPSVVPARKIGAAIAAGCSIVIKPAEETPLSVVEIARCFRAAGLPDGVLNVLYGDAAQISSSLIAAPEIRKIAITGSTRVGKILARQAAETIKPGTYELGGHSPVLVFDDADITAAATALADAKYRNAGQVCTSPTRFYVHDSVHDEFLDHYSEIVRNIKVGDGMADGTTMGPLINEDRLEYVDALIKDAQDKGARVVEGGARIGIRGCFYEPTILVDVPDNALILAEEPFGPVTVIQKFTDTKDAIARANSLPFGLGSYVFSGSPERTEMAATELQAGMVGVNTCLIAHHEAPFGGVKESGYGREGGIEGLGAYQVTKLVATKSAV